MNRKQLEKKYMDIKIECQDLEKQLKPLFKRLKKISKKSSILLHKIDYEGDIGIKGLYIKDKISNKLIPNRWNFGVYHRISDLAYYLGKDALIESIDNVLHNVKVTNFLQK